MDILVTGGAGFIGCNTVEYFMKSGQNTIHLVDNLSRKGTTTNLKNLQTAYPEVSFSNIDIRDYQAIKELIASKSWDSIIHLAGQVAVTTSTLNPREDFEINTLGTFNILEAMRMTSSSALLIYASTNKVYGELPGVNVALNNNYFFPDFPHGIPETIGLDFHSPYGCSKGAADQYVIDYSRIYDLNTVVFRQSCIYGQRQFGIEDQGWVAWFTIAAMYERPIIVYGDGMQVRDVLWVDDLVNLYEKAIQNYALVKGKAYNVGGGASRTMSLLQLLGMLELKLNKKIPVSFSAWRPGDQRVYISDIRKVSQELNWTPQTEIDVGLDLLIKWSGKNRATFEAIGLI